jgi:hypothetical protein
MKAKKNKNKNKKKDNEKNKVGRPTKYKPEYCEKMIKWFDRELTVLKEVEKVSPAGVVTIKEEKPNKPPMFGEFCRTILKVHHSTMLLWVQEHKEFSEAYKDCKEIQKEFIIMGCLMGIFNSSFGRFTLKNISDWRDHVIESQDKDEKNAIVLAYSLNENQA